MSLPFDPIRLCCGQRHDSPVCPDGLVMCCICFNRVPINMLNPIDNGYEDICLECAKDEKEYRQRNIS